MNIENELTIDETLLYSRDLTKKLGKIKLENGKTISEYLNFNEINLWTVLEPYIALYLIPLELSKNLNPHLNNKIRPKVSLFKRRLLELFKKIRGIFFSTRSINADLISFSFSDYMYTDVLKVVTERLEVEDEIKPLILTEDFKKKSLSRIDRFSIWEFWDIRCFVSSFILRAKVRRSFKELQSALSKNNLKEIHNLKVDLKYTFNWVLNFHAPSLLDKVILADKLVKELRPSTFLCPDCANPLNRILSLSGKKINAKTIEIQLAQFNQKDIELSFSLADKFALWGPSSKDAYIYNGIESNKLIYTGSSRFEDLNWNEKDKNSLKKKFNISTKKKLLLIASTAQQKEYDNLSSPDILKRMQNSVIQNTEILDDYEILIKPHPLENVSKIIEIIGSKDIQVLNKKENIKPFISICDVFISFGSTSTFDALVAKKLVVCPEFDDWAWSKWITKSNAVFNPSSEKDLLDIMHRINNEDLGLIRRELSDNKSKYLQNVIYKDEISSSKLIINLIKSAQK